MGNWKITIWESRKKFMGGLKTEVNEEFGGSIPNSTDLKYLQGEVRPLKL